MYKYRGKDRRMIENGAKVLTAIIARDVRAQNPVKTSAISTRSLIFDTNNTPGGLLNAANNLVSHLQELLIQTS